jgi:hypothetical protein
LFGIDSSSIAGLNVLAERPVDTFFSCLEPGLPPWIFGHFGNNPSPAPFGVLHPGLCEPVPLHVVALLATH